MLYVSLISIFAAVVLFILATRQKRKAGIPAGRVIYSDANQWMKVEKPLYDPNIHLTGKPDYLVRQGKQVIPIEVKSGNAHGEPRPWHVSQLAAYCLLVNHLYSNRPRYGILHYADKSIAIDFSSELENSTLAMIREMQARSSQLQIERSHQDVNRCIRCGYRSICNQSLRI